MRCDDNYQWGGCYLHGSYDPDVTPESLIDDLLVYCILAHRADANSIGLGLVSLPPIRYRIFHICL